MIKTHDISVPISESLVVWPGDPPVHITKALDLEKGDVATVSRLVMGQIPKAHCTHEPHSASLLAGANLFFPEVGASPRDGEADTGRGRGRRIEDCRNIQREMNWDPDLPSNCFKTG